MKNPRTLEVLWREYKFGVDGRKPAEQFTIEERNCQGTRKQTYYRRKIFWQTVRYNGKRWIKLLWSIWDKYSALTGVTVILDAMK